MGPLPVEDHLRKEAKKALGKAKGPKVYWPRKETKGKSKWG